MNFPLSEFELYIDETILQRGYNYFEKGLVAKVEEVFPAKFEANVLGSEVYHVQLTIDNGTVKSQLCDCPYDMGPVCKHVVAVLFHIQQDELDLAATPKPKKKKKPRGRSVMKQVEDVLNTLSHDELKEYVEQLAKDDVTFRRSLLSHFAHLNKNESMTLYTQQVKDILRKAAGRDGFIYWDAARKVGKEVNGLLSTAYEHAEKGNFRTAMLIAFAIMEQMTDALQYADDSNADIGGSIDAAFSLVRDLASDELPEADRSGLFDLALTAYENRIFNGWDWDLGMLELGSELISTDEDTQRLSALLDMALRDENDFWADQAQNIKLKLIRKSEGDDAAKKFMDVNLENPLMRKEAIELAIREKDFDRATLLAEKGIELDLKPWPGRVWDWYHILMTIAQMQNNTEKVVEYAQLLYLNSNRDTRPYYAILKENVKEQEWVAFVDGLISELERSGWFSRLRVPEILVDQQRWAQLMEWLKTNLANGSIGLRTVADLEKHLAHLYSEELSSLYHQGIVDLLKTNVGRKYYVEACRYIRRMKKLGATEQVGQLIWHLRQTYPQRPALMQELNRV